MNDSYSHSTNNLLYITESIPGPTENTVEYEKILDNYNSQYNGCNCKQNCNIPVCACINQSHGINYEIYNTGGKDMYRIHLKPDAYPIYECTSKCPCSSTCGNRLVQKGPIENLIVKPCKYTQKGMGLFSLTVILKGSFICEYAGEVLTKSQALARIKENRSKKRDNFIFCLNEHSITEKTQTFVDPSQFGNIGRYINHGCDPNCCVVPVRCNTLIPKLAIFACRDIEANEEITFSYGTDCLSTESKTKITGINCHCNADNCQGYLPYNEF